LFGAVSFIMFTIRRAPLTREKSMLYINSSRDCKGPCQRISLQVPLDALRLCVFCSDQSQFVRSNIRSWNRKFASAARGIAAADDTAFEVVEEQEESGAPHLPTYQTFLRQQIVNLRAVNASLADTIQAVRFSHNRRHALSSTSSMLTTTRTLDVDDFDDNDPLQKAGGEEIDFDDDETISVCPRDLHLSPGDAEDDIVNDDDDNGTDAAPQEEHEDNNGEEGDSSLCSDSSSSSSSFALTPPRRRFSADATVADGSERSDDDTTALMEWKKSVIRAMTTAVAAPQRGAKRRRVIR
jgi:hypothetical protein